jgi:hypothetical protein
MKIVNYETKWFLQKVYLLEAVFSIQQRQRGRAINDIKTNYEHKPWSRNNVSSDPCSWCGLYVKNSNHHFYNSRKSVGLTDLTLTLTREAKLQLCCLHSHLSSAYLVGLPQVRRERSTCSCKRKNCTGQFKKKATLSLVYNPAGYRTPFSVESPFCNTVSPGGGGLKHFPAPITNKLWGFY